MQDKKFWTKLKLQIQNMKKGADIKKEDYDYYMNFFNKFIGDLDKSNLLKKDSLTDEIKSIIRVYIAFQLKTKNYSEAKKYLNLFDDSGWKYRTVALIEFRSLKYPENTQKFKILKYDGKNKLEMKKLEYPEKMLPNSFSKIISNLIKSLNYNDKNIEHTLDILEEYFDKVFGLPEFENHENKTEFINNIINNIDYKIFTENERIKNYFSIKLKNNNLNSDEQKNLIIILEEKIEELESIIEKKNEYIKKIQEQLNKGNTIINQEKKEDVINNSDSENIFISIGIIGGKKDKRSLEFLMEDKSWMEELKINPNNISFRFYQAWESNNRNSIYSVISQNDILIVGKNDHIWTDIPAEYNGSTQGIFNFLKNEKDSEGTPLCRFVYNGIPDENSTKRPKLSKSTLKGLMIQGVKELLRERHNDAQTMVS